MLAAPAGTAALSVSAPAICYKCLPDPSSALLLIFVDGCTFAHCILYCAFHLCHPCCACEVVVYYPSNTFCRPAASFVNLHKYECIGSTRPRPPVRSCPLFPSMSYRTRTPSRPTYIARWCACRCTRNIASLLSCCTQQGVCYDAVVHNRSQYVCSRSGYVA